MHTGTPFQIMASTEDKAVVSVPSLHAQASVIAPFAASDPYCSITGDLMMSSATSEGTETADNKGTSRVFSRLLSQIGCLLAYHGALTLPVKLREPRRMGIYIGAATMIKSYEVPPLWVQKKF